MRGRSKAFPAGAVSNWSYGFNPFRMNMMDQYWCGFDTSMMDTHGRDSIFGDYMYGGPGLGQKSGRWTLPYARMGQRRRTRGPGGHQWWGNHIHGHLFPPGDDSEDEDWSSDDDDLGHSPDGEQDNVKQIPIRFSSKEQSTPTSSHNRGRNWNNSHVDLTHELDSEAGLDSLECESSDSDSWIPELRLTMKDKRELQEGRMLSDKHMSAAQILLGQQFPWVSGFQDTCLSQTSFGSVDQEGVQIHHTRGNHWVVSACLGGRLQVYDTIYSGVTKDLRKQLVEIYPGVCDDDWEGGGAGEAGAGAGGRCIFVELPSIPKQTGSRDCGLYAIAIAYELCCGNFNVTGLRFKQAEMRKHLLECFQGGDLEPFPRDKVEESGVTRFEEIEF